MNETKTTRRTGFGRLRRWLAMVGMAGSAFLLTGGMLPAGAHTAPDAGSMLVAAHSQKAMDIPGASSVAGMPLIQWTIHGEPNQTFVAVHFATVGDVRLYVYQSTLNGLVLDVAGGSTAEGASVVQKQWTGSASQVWWEAAFGPTGYNLLVNMGSGKVASVANASTANGAAIVQTTWAGGANQLWAHAAFIH